jgi:hypothetical protein
MVLRLKFFYLQLEENASITHDFLMKEFPDRYVQFQMPNGMKGNEFQNKSKGGLNVGTFSSWKSPFGSEVRGIDNLDNNDLVLELSVMRQRINEYQRIYCLYSKCLGSMNKFKSNSDVSSIGLQLLNAEEERRAQD